MGHAKPYLAWKRCLSSSASLATWPGGYFSGSSLHTVHSCLSRSSCRCPQCPPREPTWNRATREPSALGCPLPKPPRYSQAAGFVEGTGLVQRVWGLVSRGDLQVAGDVDLEGKLSQNPQFGLILFFMQASTALVGARPGGQTHLTRFLSSPANLKASTTNCSVSCLGRGDTKAEVLSSALPSTKHLDREQKSGTPQGDTAPPHRPHCTPPYPLRSIKA